MALPRGEAPYNPSINNDRYNELSFDQQYNPDAALFRSQYQFLPYAEGDLILHRQLSPSPTYLASVDRCRLRRQPSQVNLGHQPSNVAPSSKDESYLDTPPHTAISTPNFSLSLLLPPFGTPTLSHAATSPSLSSTVDTIVSSPSPPPPTIVNGSYPTSPRLINGGDSVEPLRSKRKFSSLRRAKRLPHPHEDVWQVHAAVRQVDAGIPRAISSSSSSSSSDSEPTESDRRQDHRVLINRAASAKAARRKGEPLSVRFEGFDSYRSSQIPEEPRQHTRTQTDTSSSSPNLDLNFPAPPRLTWEGTFGHLGGSTSPRSPATLQYRGTDFDVVNPHESLLLGNHQFETPAEIDGLLDDYFDDFSPFGDTDHEPTIERMSSHPSMTGSESSRRTRVLYEDAESARRNILHVQGTPYARSNDEFSLRDLEATVPAPLNIRRNVQPQESRSRNIRNSVLGFLGIGVQHATEAADQERHPAQELQELEEGRFADQHRQELDDLPPRPDSPSSVYPPLKYGDVSDQNPDPFVIGEDENDDGDNYDHLELDHPLHTSNQDQYASDHAFNRRGDVDQADDYAGHDNAIDRINTSYGRPYIRGEENVSSGFIGRYRDSWPSLSDSEDDRGNESDWQTDIEDNHDDNGTVASQNRERAPGSSTRRYTRRQPITGSPRVTAPPAPFVSPERRTGNPYVHASYSDLPDTDQTYGATDELLASPTRIKIRDLPQTVLPGTGNRPQRGNSDNIHGAEYSSNIGVAITTEHRSASGAPQLPPIWSNSDFRRAHSEHNNGRSLSHVKQALSQAESEWATEADSEDGNDGTLRMLPFDPFVHRLRVSSGDSYADTSVYGSENEFEDDDQTVLMCHEVASARVRSHDAHAMEGPSNGLATSSPTTPALSQRKEAVENLRQASERRKDNAQASTPIRQRSALISSAERARAISMVHEDSPLDRISKSCRHWGDFLKTSLWPESNHAAQSDTELLIQHGDNRNIWGPLNGTEQSEAAASTRAGTSTPNVDALPQDTWTPLPFPSAAHVNPTSRMPTRPSRPSVGRQASVTSQIELQPLNLARDRAPTRSRYGPLTDSELIAHEPRWAEHVRSRSLLPTTASASSRRRATDKLEGWWVEICLAFPLSPLLFGLGAFDWAVRRTSRGRITEVSPSLKRASLTTMLPLNLLVWGVIAGMVALFVWVGHRAT